MLAVDFPLDPANKSLKASPDPLEGCTGLGDEPFDLGVVVRVVGIEEPVEESMENASGRRYALFPAAGSDVGAGEERAEVDIEPSVCGFDGAVVFHKSANESDMLQITIYNKS